MYVELHCHSCYSLLEGASQPEELVLRARELGYRALALTDHDGLYGAMQFAQLAKAWDLQPITGAEITLDDGGHLTLLAETQQGYSNLCRIITHAHLSNEKGDPKVDRETIRQHAAGLIALSGCRKGDLARLVDAGLDDEAIATARRYAEWFPGSFYVELQQNFVRGDTTRIRKLRRVARLAGLPVVATNNVHYHVRERHRLQDVLVAIKHRLTLDTSHQVRRPNGEFWLKPPELMVRLFQEIPEAIRSTLVIAERCQSFDLTQDLGYTFPNFARDEAPEVQEAEIQAEAAAAPQVSSPGSPLPISGEDGASSARPAPLLSQQPSSISQEADVVLARHCWAAFEWRYGTAPPELRQAAAERLREELRLVAKHGLSGFFLVYRDLLDLAKEVAVEVRGERPRGRFDPPPGRGRGSSVSSIICYLIGLSHVDPVKNNLFLGRFLNEELHSVPDIDLDFAREIRERLILRVYERYGHEHVGLVCTFPTYRLRSAVREIGKVLGLPAGEIDKLARLAEWRSAKDLRDEMLRLPDFKDRVDAPLWRDLIDLAEQISGFPRHVSQHVGGMIISSKPLIDLVPLEKTRMEGRIVCQWDKDSCDDARFIKVDFLALGMLSLVEECLDLIVEQGKEPVDLSRIDFSDPVVYDRICAGDTVGVFQIESRAQIQMLPRTQPRNLDDLAVEVAIVRPGPIVGGAVNPYVRRREQQRRNPSFRPPVDHPLLRPCLEETLGIILYQDQVLEVCQALAGFTVSQAEQLRRSMSRRRSREAMEAFWPLFKEGSARKGVPERVAKQVFEKVVAFSEFGFPKSHSHAFAVLAFQSAWLREYHPVEYTTALLNNQPMGFYPLDVIVNDAQRHGLRFRRPDINRSGAMCTVEGRTDQGVEPAIRIGLAFVDGVGKARAEAIVAEREANGPFLSLADFVRRCDLSREATEHLIAIGAFDGFGLSRREALWLLGLLVRPYTTGAISARARSATSRPGHTAPGGRDAAANAGRRYAAKQLPLPLSTEQDMVDLRPMTDWERMLADYGLMQLSPEYHPLGLLRPHLQGGEVFRRIAELQQIPDGASVECAGLVVTRQRPGTAKGFVFLLIEDETGVVNVVISPDLYSRERQVVRGEVLVAVAGKLQRKNGTTNLLAERIAPLQLPATPPGELTGLTDPLAAAAAQAHGGLTVPDVEYRVANTQSKSGSSNVYHTTHRLGVRVGERAAADAPAPAAGETAQSPAPAEVLTLEELRLLNIPVHSFY